MSNDGYSKLAALAIAAGAASLAFLYVWNPSEIPIFPKCPFYLLTGYKCPGCGTLRGMHALLHFRILDALKCNAYMVVSIPVVLLLLLWPKFRFSVTSARIILVMTLLWWLMRNLVA